jgi:hypothetical protein
MEKIFGIDKGKCRENRTGLMPFVGT